MPPRRHQPAPAVHCLAMFEDPEIAWHPSGTRYAVHRMPRGVLRVHNVGEERCTLHACNRYTDTVAWNVEGTQLAAVLTDGRQGPPGIAIIDYPSGRMHEIPWPIRAGDSTLSWSPCGQWIAHATDDTLTLFSTGHNSALTVDVPGRQEFFVWREHAWSPDGRRFALATGSQLYVWERWALLAGEKPLFRMDHNDCIGGLAWSGSGDTLAYRCSGRLYTWDPEAGVCAQPEWHVNPAATAWRRDLGFVYATRDTDNVLRVRALPEALGAPIDVETLPADSRTFHVQWTPDASAVSWLDTDGAVVVRPVFPGGADEVGR